MATINNDAGARVRLRRLLGNAMVIPPLTQLQAFADFETKERPDPKGRKHVAQWAVEEIERLMKEVEDLKAQVAHCKQQTPF